MSDLQRFINEAVRFAALVDEEASYKVSQLQDGITRSVITSEAVSDQASVEPTIKKSGTIKTLKKADICL